MWKLFKNFPRHSTLDTEHYFSRGNIGGYRTQNVNMILTDHTTQNENFELLTSLLGDFPYSQSNIFLEWNRYFATQTR
jgi:hypothetical protein